MELPDNVHDLQITEQQTPTESIGKFSKTAVKFSRYRAKNSKMNNVMTRISIDQIQFKNKYKKEQILLELDKK